MRHGNNGNLAGIQVSPASRRHSQILTSVARSEQNGERFCTDDSDSDSDTEGSSGGGERASYTSGGPKVSGENGSPSMHLQCIAGCILSEDAL